MPDLLMVAIADLGAASADAAAYKMVLCAANNGSNGFATQTNTASSQNPGGIFAIENYCGPAPDPAGDHAFLRIAENQSGGSAANTAYGQVSWTAAPWISILAAGGYTRQPGAFNDGWRGRFWAEDFGGGGPHNILMQGTGAANSGISWSPTSTFASHLWPFGNFGSYRRFVFELTCMRPAGCDRSGFNAVDANSIVLILEDASPSQVALTNTDKPLLGGQWVRGTQVATYAFTELGSGIRMERIRIDGAERFTIDHVGAQECNRDASQVNGEFARDFQPCAVAPSPIGRSFTFDTATLADGAHGLSACTQDYAQWQGLYGTAGESCEQRTIRVDNTAPGAPSGLVVTSANPQRYLDRFGARFSLPPNQGSPIAKVHYSVLDAAGEVVVPEKVVVATNPTELSDLVGPTQAGAYQLRVRLEDEVGLIGPAATAPIPHDTTPPAAPQGLSVAAPGISRAEQGFDLRWNNLPDGGSPIAAAHYQVLDGASRVVASQRLDGPGIESIADLDAPKAPGSYSLRLWLADAEGNVGAPVSAPLAYDCVRSEVAGGTALSAGLGKGAAAVEVVEEGESASLGGALRGGGGGVAGAPLCVFGTVVTDSDPQFLGIALTGQGGGYQFAVAPGPSRNLSVIYRPDQRQIAAQATVQTRVRPTLRLQRKVVHNKGYARFSGEIPGPHNDNVVVVLQVKSGKGWLAFRRYRTRADGHFSVRYRFHRATRLTTYVMRAQIRNQAAYPYEQGNSRSVRLQVLP